MFSVNVLQRLILLEGWNEELSRLERPEISAGQVGNF